MIPSIFSNKQSTTMNSNSSAGSLPWDVHRKRKTITDGADNEATATDGADNEATAIKATRMTNPQWTDQEDSIITDAVINSLEKPFTRWCDLSQKLPNRDGKRIRDRWVNQLDPNINRLLFSREEDLRLWDGYKKFGKKWVEISMKLFQSTRPENQIKNRWYSASFKKFISIAVTTDNIKNNGEPPGRGFTIANPTLSTSALAEDPAIRPGHTGIDGGSIPFTWYWIRFTRYYYHHPKYLSSTIDRNHASICTFSSREELS